ncbi:4'-phosphopantetheinyl transferase family protein [Kitasatospora sp. NPDC052896]|uniref:4'-phosphopantetheinyl transferase family protein n=1 Tax=Kitasatospora sp. NPDC052896 TaxID=3364061 RepID=UPI0037CA7A29
MAISPAGDPARPGARLWLLRPAAAELSALSLAELDEAERRRAAGFVRAADQVLYASAHIALRRVLADRLGTAPQLVRLGRDRCPGCGGPHGRPVVLGAPFPLHFSLSHTNGLVLLGLAAVPLGVDVQVLAEDPRVAACAPVFHPVERAELTRLDPTARRPAFTRLWARKEAHLKGVGTGVLRAALAEHYLGSGGPGAPAGPAGWTVLDIPCGPGHRAAAAIRSTDPGRVTVRWLELGRPAARHAAPPGPTAHHLRPPHYHLARKELTDALG